METQSERIKRVAVEVAELIEKSGVQAAEVPVILGSLVNGLATQIGAHPELVLGLVRDASDRLSS